MSMQHFLLPDGLSAHSISLKDPELLHQLIKVLRFKAGDHCILMDGKGKKAESRLELLHKKEAVFEVIHTEEISPQAFQVRLYCGISKKPATFEFIVQKATELGVSEIIPLVTARCQVQQIGKLNRLQAILKEACEQSERAFAPELKEPMSLKSLLATPPSGILLAGDARADGLKLTDAPKTQDLNLIIGPEGGLTSEELDAIVQSGGQIFLLGENVLRMETAALAALALVLCR
jgi:16S rRNA (uracil1498-N3)-methyltransferase